MQTQANTLVEPYIADKGVAAKELLAHMDSILYLSLGLAVWSDRQKTNTY